MIEINSQEHLDCLDLNKEILTMGSEARTLAGKKLGFTVLPESRMCLHVAPALCQIAYLRQYSVDLLESGVPGTIHQFVRVWIKSGLNDNNPKGIPYVVDAAYLQYVDREKRIGLPPVFYHNISTKEDLVDALTRHQIPRYYHAWWIKRLFNDQ